MPSVESHTVHWRRYGPHARKPVQYLFRNGTRTTKSSRISLELENIEARLSVLEKEAEFLRKRKDYLLLQPPSSSLPSSSSSSSTENTTNNPSDPSLNPFLPHYLTPIPHPDVQRYSRQMLVPAFGPSSQTILSSLAVLVIGAGGLGCPVSLNLAAAGIGRLGIIDNDTVDISNLHRQIGHTESKYGMNKAESLVSTCQGINSTIHYSSYSVRVGHPSSLPVLKDILPLYDILVDATDNPGTRYLINDLAVYYNKPLVSGAALGTDGQLMTYNYRNDENDHEKGPCYRCLFPNPPIQDPNIATSCADAGVLGPVTSVIGTLQALEVLKIATARYRYVSQQSSEASSISSRSIHNHHLPNLGLPMYKSLLLFDGNESKFRSMRIKGYNPECIVCGTHPTLRTIDDSIEWNQKHQLTLYEDSKDTEATSDKDCQVCTIDTKRLQQVSSSLPQISSRSLQLFLQYYATLPVSPFPLSIPVPSSVTPIHLSLPLLLDVREPHQYGISRLRESINIPLSVLRKLSTASTLSTDTPHLSTSSASSSASVRKLQALLHAVGYTQISILPHVDPALEQLDWSQEILVPLDRVERSRIPEVCVLCRRGIDSSTATELLTTVFGIRAYNIQGGLEAYQKQYDKDYPVY